MTKSTSYRLRLDLVCSDALEREVDMKNHGVPVLLGMLVLLSGCIEVNVVLQLEPNGRALFSSRVEISPKVVETLYQIKALDPSQEMLDDFPKKPTKAMLKTMKKSGAKVVVDEYSFDETSAVMAFHANLKSVAAMGAMSELMGSGSNPSNIRLTRGDNDVYTLTLVSGSQIAPPQKSAENAEKPPDQEVAQEVMKLLFSMMNEIGALNFQTRFEVPGEIVEFAQKDLATVEGNVITWTITGNDMLNTQDPKSNDDMSVQFKLKDGAQIPKKALYDPAP